MFPHCLSAQTNSYMQLSKPLACKKREPGTVYIIICSFCARAAYIVARTWSSSSWVLASDFLFRCLSQLPECLQRSHISEARDEEMSAPASVLQTEAREARVTTLTSENTIVSGDIYHAFIILPSHEANSSPPLSFCLPLSLTPVFNHLNRLWVNMCGWVAVLMTHFPLCALCVTVSGETACCWTLPCCLGWATNGWWPLSRWRRSEGSRTSIAASRCPRGAPLCPTLENLLSEVR